MTFTPKHKSVNLPLSASHGSSHDCPHSPFLEHTLRARNRGHGKCHRTTSGCCANLDLPTSHSSCLGRSPTCSCPHTQLLLRVLALQHSPQRSVCLPLHTNKHTHTHTPKAAFPFSALKPLLYAPKGPGYTSVTAPSTTLRATVQTIL